MIFGGVISCRGGGLWTEFAFVFLFSWRGRGLGSAKRGFPGCGARGLPEGVGSAWTPEAAFVITSLLVPLLVDRNSNGDEVIRCPCA